MNRFITVLLLNVLLLSSAYAANWTQLQDNKHASLVVDKQSIAESGAYQKAWVKMQYKTIQTNLEYPDKSYNNAKLLWYFNCKEQKSATAQVYQLLDDEQVFSAAIDVKRARFIEPVPETEIELAMRYVCKSKADKEAAKIRLAEKAEKREEAAKQAVVTQGKGKTTAKDKSAPAEAKPSEKVVEEVTDNNLKDKKDKKHKKDKNDLAGDLDKGDASESHIKEKKKSRKKPKKHTKSQWKYKGNKGPEFWADLSPDYAACQTGRYQSPIDIMQTIDSDLKPLKTFQRFPVKNILNDGHTIQANFKPGNMLMLNGTMFQMKHVQFHSPSEHTINGKTFPLEAHFVHADPKGNLAILAVMFDEGAENKAIAKLWKQMPRRKGKPKKLKTKVLASELMPRKKGFYRFSGSLTMPPCHEGVIWVVKKTVMTTSKSQIEAFQKVMKHDNNRPLQALNGRLIINQSVK